MKIVIDKKFSEMLMAKLAEYVASSAKLPDGKYHVSELLNPRYAYFARLNGYKPTADDAWMFLPGIAFHELLQKVLGKELAEHKLYLEDIVGTADMVGAYFSEIKTSRKYTVPDMPAPHYVEQFEKYLAIAGRDSGWIIVIYFTAGRKWDGSRPSTLEIVTWKVTMSQQERKEALKSLIRNRDMLKQAEATKDFRSLPLCWPFMCVGAYKGEVTKLCPAYYTCKPAGRYPLKVGIAFAEKNR